MLIKSFKSYSLFVVTFLFFAGVKAQNVGIGTVSPAGRLHIDMNGASNNFAILIDDEDADIPTIRIRKAGVSKAFALVEGNDFKLGTYATNPTGKLILETNSSSRMYFTPAGNIGIGIADPVSRFQIVGGAEASLITHGYFMLGSETGTNLVVDNNEIQARNNGAISHLYLQSEGGATQFGQTADSNIEIENTTISAFFNGVSETLILQPNGKTRLGSGFDFANTKLHISEGVDAGAANNQSGYMMIGLTNSENVVFDNNEILARNNGVLGDLHIQRDGGDLILLDNNNLGRIGVSTASPFSKLHIATGQDVGLANTSNGYIMLGSGTGSNLIIDNNEILARSNIQPGGQGADLFIQHDGGNVILCGTEQGGVGIGIVSGTSIPLGYMLAVDGKIISEELKVQMSGSWPDYVFAENYNLKPLDELRRFIAQNKHLPGIPPAAEVEKNGIEVGDMQKRMMEKIEELTLYVLKLEEEIQKIKKQN